MDRPEPMGVHKRSAAAPASYAGSMFEPLRSRLEAELEYAAQARSAGKEGRARVCARRAAGWAVGVYRQETGADPVPERAALVHLRWLHEQADFPPQLRQAAARLTEHITVDHQLPHVEDPLEDARLIVQAMLRQLVAGRFEVDDDR